MKFSLFVLLLGWAAAALALDQDRSFDQWLEDFRGIALERGINEKTLDTALKGLEPDPRVIGFDRKQPEFEQTFEEYLSARVNDFRIEQGRHLYEENRETLQAIAERYDVDPQYLVAFWGLESSFGRHQGTYSVVRSLATLAYDPRRSRFFTEELIAALRILEEGHVPLDEFVGGWAGAMGQNQFLPSSFLNYAQDFDGDGRKNIWSSRQDVWASVANYLQRNGWDRSADWGFAAVLSEPLEFEALRPDSVPSGCRALRHHTRKLPWSRWKELGVRAIESEPPLDARFAMVVPEEGETTVYLAGKNFRTILSYNCANKYAVSVGLLADLIVEGAD